MLAGFVWWELLLMAICAISFFVAVAAEIDGMAVVIFLITFALFQWLFKVDLWSYLLLNYLSFLLYSVYYFIIGSVWSIFKWFRFVKTELKEYLNLKQAFLKKHQVVEIPLPLLEAWKSEISYKSWPPSPSKHKGIVRWILVWPVYMVWFILEDFLSWVGEKLYSCISRVYSSISDRLFAEMKKDMRND